MINLRYLLVISSLVLAANLFAQRPEGPPDGKHDRRGGGGAAASMAERALERVATVDPETATRLKELQDQDPEAFRRELRNVMMQHGPELFRGGDREGGKGGGKPGGFDGRGGQDGFPGRGVFDRLRREDPTQFEELAKLRKNDPEAYKQRIIEITREYGERYKRGRDEVRRIMDVAKRYQASEDEAEKATLRSELEALVAASFDKQIEEKEAWIKKLATDLDEQRERLAERRTERDSLIKERLETILSGAPMQSLRPAGGGMKPGKFGKGKALGEERR
ncbi:MAG: hypothetical protein ACI8W8_001387 [Rhodothermales bacterium]|jgi:hypothetical protein